MSTALAILVVLGTYASVKLPERARAEEAAKAAAVEAEALAAVEAASAQSAATTENVAHSQPDQTERPLQVIASTFKIVDRGPYFWKVAYKIDIMNSSDEDININVKVDFMDDAGFPVSEDYLLNKSFGGRRKTSATGIKMVSPAVGRKIKSVEVGS